MLLFGTKKWEALGQSSIPETDRNNTWPNFCPWIFLPVGQSKASKAALYIFIYTHIYMYAYMVRIPDGYMYICGLEVGLWITETVQDHLHVELLTVDIISSWLLASTYWVSIDNKLSVCFLNILHLSCLNFQAFLLTSDLLYIHTPCWLMQDQLLVQIILYLPESFRPHYGPGVNSAPNRNEYLVYILRGKGGRCVEITLPLSRRACPGL